eukprot:930521-Rhodomonas_salina.1
MREKREVRSADGIPEKRAAERAEDTAGDRKDGAEHNGQRPLHPGTHTRSVNTGHRRASAKGAHARVALGRARQVQKK